MVLLVPIIISLLSISSAKFEFEQYNVDRYLRFIIDISAFHRSSTVFFSHAGTSKDDLTSHTLLHSWSRAMSRRGIMTLSIPFWKLQQTRINHNRLINPLFVILLTDESSLTNFSDAMQNRDISSAIYLAIFLWTPESSDIDYCHSPPGNIFSLTFSTVMLVVCQNDVILREWYSLQENQTKISDVAVWKEDRGLVRISNLRMYEKRVDMEGRVLRGVIVKDNPVAAIRNGILDGLFGSLMTELSVRMNFMLEIEEILEYGTWNKDENRWTGAVAEITSGRADIAISDFSVTGMRLTVADYTFPVMHGNDCLMIKKPCAIDIRWLAYFQAFSFKLWMALVLLITISSLMIIFMNVVNGSKCSMSLILEQCMNVQGIFCQQGLAEYPRKHSLQVAYFSLFVSAFIMSAVYSAALICFLTFHTQGLPFLSLKDFVRDGTYKLIVIRNSAAHERFTHSNESLSRNVRRFLEPSHRLPTRISEAYLQVCNRDKVAFYTSDISRPLLNFTFPCEVTCIRTGQINNYALMLPKGSPLTGIINSHLREFMNNGIMDHLKGTKYWTMYREESTGRMPIALADVASVLAILGAGFMLCVLVLVMEMVYFRLSKRNQAKNEQSVFTN